MVAFHIVLSWSVFAVLIRMESEFRTVGVFPYFGFFSAAAAFLGFFAGLFQEDWRKSLFIWGSSSHALSWSFLVFSGPWTATALSISTSLAVFGMAVVGEQPQANVSAKKDQQNKDAVRLGIYLCAALGVGGYGFISSGAIANTLLIASINHVQLAITTCIIFFWAVLLWKVMLSILSQGVSAQSGWIHIGLPIFLSILGSGVLWTGTWEWRS